MGDRIVWVGVSSVYLPLLKSVSDAKVLTGRQKPLDGVQILLAEIDDGNGQTGLGFSYSLRTGGAGQYAHAREIAPALLGEDASDIGRLWNKLVWLGASAGRSGIGLQAIAEISQPTPPRVSIETTVPCIPGNPKPSSSCSKG